MPTSKLPNDVMIWLEQQEDLGRAPGIEEFGVVFDEIYGHDEVNEMAHALGLNELGHTLESDEILF